jgi:hypothetical protein
MHRMRGVMLKVGLALAALLVSEPFRRAQGDLIRPQSSRGYPDITGDLVGVQTYTFDAGTQTGTFQVINAPQFIALGPGRQDLVSVLPDQEGTLSQTLRMKLDRNGKLVDTDENRFELHGTVVIGHQVFSGLLLAGKPTAFGAQVQSQGTPNGDAFDLNVTITGGELAEAFGREAYLRVIPQSRSTFEGNFAADFSGEKPMTNLRPLQGSLPAAVPEPAPFLVLTIAGLALAIQRLRRCLVAKRRRPAAPDRLSSIPLQ